MHLVLSLAMVAAMLLAATSVVAASAADLAWLAGCWASESGEAGSGEHWMAPAGGSLLGVGRQVRDGRTADYEWLRIIENGDGSLTYLAAPGGRKAVAFPLTSLGKGRVVFENPDHDFPQRVIYEIRGERLLARIEGEQGGTLRGVDFPMRRATCPGG